MIDTVTDAWVCGISFPSSTVKSHQPHLAPFSCGVLEAWLGHKSSSRRGEGELNALHGERAAPTVYLRASCELFLHMSHEALEASK